MSVVNGISGDVIGIGAFPCVVTIKCISNVYLDGTTIWIPRATYVYTDASGNFSVTLQAGMHKVTFNGLYPIYILVPVDTATYNIQKLIYSLGFYSPGTSSMQPLVCTGSPNGQIIGTIGNLCWSADFMILYVKATGIGTNTGWLPIPVWALNATTALVNPVMSTGADPNAALTIDVGHTW